MLVVYVQRAKFKCFTKQPIIDYVSYNNDNTIMACPREVVQHLVSSKYLHTGEAVVLEDTGRAVCGSKIRDGRI